MSDTKGGNDVFGAADCGLKAFDVGFEVFGTEFVDGVGQGPMKWEDCICKNYALFDGLDVLFVGWSGGHFGHFANIAVDAVAVELEVVTEIE